MKKKVAFFINSFRNCGPANILLSMIHGIDKNKYEPYLITLLNENDKTYINNAKNIGVKVIELGQKKNLKTMLKGKKLTKGLNSYNFDVVHFHSHIVSIMFRKINAKKIVTVHNKLYEDFKGTYGKTLGYIVTKIYVSVITRFDKVVCCSQSSFNLCKKYLTNATFVRNGMWFKDEDKKSISETRKKIRDDLNIPYNSIVYIYAGNYNHAKNIIQLLDFYSKSLKDDEYLICLGKGELSDQTSKIQHDRIIQLGFKQNVYDYLKASDVYTSFSLTEGFPVSIIEALHYDLKLLLSNIDAHQECLNIDNNYNIGKVFDLRSYDDFNKCKDEVNSFLSNNSVKFQRKYLSDKCMMENYEKIYESLMKKN